MQNLTISLFWTSRETCVRRSPKPTSTPYSPPPERKNGSTGPRTEGFQTVFLAHWYLLTLDTCGHQKPLFWVLFWHHWDAVERQMGIPNLSVTQLGPLVCTWSRNGAPWTQFGRKQCSILGFMMLGHRFSQHFLGKLCFMQRMKPIKNIVY